MLPSDPHYHVKFFEKFAGPVFATWQGDEGIRSSDVRAETDNWGGSAGCMAEILATCGAEGML